MDERHDVIIIGAGQAGLAMGYHLYKSHRDFVILEQAAKVAPAWRGRWDSFSLVLPNWTLQLPDYAYHGQEPDGFLPRDEVVAYMEGFAASFDVEIRFNTRVLSIESPHSNGSYLIKTNNGRYIAKNVVVATGTYQKPRIPLIHKKIAGDIEQLHTSEYRNPEQLRDGAVLVVGSGQSGSQIAEELYQSGRNVYLCVGSAMRLPRFYRGRDSIYWLGKMGFFDQTVDTLPSPKARFVANPFLSGKEGGRSLNLHRFARDGVHLLGRLLDASGHKVKLATDLHDNLTRQDEYVAQVKRDIDEYILANQIDAEQPADEIELKDGYDQDPINELDLKDAGITAIIWATGYDFDFSLVKLPVQDEYGYPIQTRGVTEYPGLFFLGLFWLYKRRSGIPWGVGDDAAYIARKIRDRG